MASAPKKSRKKEDKKLDPRLEKLRRGYQEVNDSNMFSLTLIRIELTTAGEMGNGCAVKVKSDGTLYANREHDLSPSEWAFCLVHSYLHLAFGHFDAEKMPGYRNSDGAWVVSCDPALWNLACDLYIDRFLMQTKFGIPIVSETVLDSYPHGSSEIELYHQLAEQEFDPAKNDLGTAGTGKMDMIGLDHPLTYAKGKENEFSRKFADMISWHVQETIGNAAEKHRPYHPLKSTVQNLSNRVPLLGAIAAGFRIVDIRTANMQNVEVAAVDVTQSTIYINHFARLSEAEWCFVLAHEYLHAGLQHHARRQGRDPYLWNVACDYVVNGWLVEMQVGKMPEIGLLYDETLRSLSAEEIYDILIKDIRRHSKLKTFRGYGMGDIIADEWSPSDKRYVTLDEFYRNALAGGLEYVQQRKRGLVPAGLVEEIRALAMPPIPWDVELARWFEVHFPPLEKHRSYAHPSRRQSSTPDIPRAGWLYQETPEHSRTFGVIIDTSGSMPPSSIGLALGAAASYSAAREVPFVRLVFCDAAPTDLGYVTPDEIAGRVEVTGRGGTRLQPTVDLLEQAEDFPPDAPILVITDGGIENDLRIRNKHAFLIPFGCRLPFTPTGEVFCFKEREDGS